MEKAKSILVVKANGALVRLNCPFWVLVTTDVGQLKQQRIMEVDMVIFTVPDEIWYKIFDKGYPHYCFSIIRLEKRV